MIDALKRLLRGEAAPPKGEPDPLQSILETLAAQPAIQGMLEAQADEEAARRQAKLDEIGAIESAIVTEAGELDDKLAEAAVNVEAARAALNEASEEHARLANRRHFGFATERQRAERIRLDLASTADPRIDKFIAALRDDYHACGHKVITTRHSRVRDRSIDQLVDVTESDGPSVAARCQAIISAMRAAEELKVLADHRNLPELLQAILETIPTAFPMVRTVRYPPTIAPAPEPRAKGPKYWSPPGNIFDEEGSSQ